MMDPHGLRIISWARVTVTIVATLGLAGCVLAPRAATVERQDMEAAGQRYAKAFNARDLPPLPASPDAASLVRRAIEANGEVEAAYFEWAAAVHRIEQAGGYPNTPLSASFSYALNGGGSAFDRTSVTIGPDPMENLAFPSKVYQAAKVALNDARAARARFSAKAFDVRKGVLNLWSDYALQAERIRIQRENVCLLRLLANAAAGRLRAGGSQQDVIRADTAARFGENELANLEATLPQQRAQLNAMLARDPDATLAPPATLPSARRLDVDDAAVLALAAKRNPQLASLAAQVSGRSDAVELARLQYIPDFNPFLGLTGTVSQFVGLGVSIPTFLPEVRGRVSEARAALSGTLAIYRQTKFDTAASVVAALVMVRNGERQASFFARQIVPSAEQLLSLSQQQYAAGGATFTDLIDAQRTLLGARVGLAEALASRESALADLEALVGMQLDEFRPAATQPSEERGRFTRTAEEGDPNHE